MQILPTTVLPGFHKSGATCTHAASPNKDGRMQHCYHIFISAVYTDTCGCTLKCSEYSHKHCGSGTELTGKICNW